MRILHAGTAEALAFLDRLKGRGRSDARVEGEVRRILDAVRDRGDAALIELTERYDGFRPTPQTLRLQPEELEAAAVSLEPRAAGALALAAERIEAFHRRQRRESWIAPEEGVGVLGQLVRPLRRVGLYVPGGSAAYPSSVLMNALPARVAGVAEVVLCTPPGQDGRVPAAVLAAARLAGIGEIYRVGGAQAVAALAYGTQTVRPVDKIVGPGNVYVTTAKRLVFGVVGIDMLAGPSEVLVVSDGTAPASWVAADLLAQAEHDAMAAAVCLTPAPEHARAVQQEVERQVAELPRADRARAALQDFGAIVVVDDLAAAVRLAAVMAPEHLELLVADPWALVTGVRNAGAIFLGPHTPEAAGDYLAGPNHVLPTGGSARYGSPLSVDDFVQRSSLVALMPAALAAWEEPIQRLARLEGLEAHARAIAIRRNTA
jgi:histidinol dehydrogenase